MDIRNYLLRSMYSKNSYFATIMCLDIYIFQFQYHAILSICRLVVMHCSTRHISMSCNFCQFHTGNTKSFLVFEILLSYFRSPFENLWAFSVPFPVQLQKCNRCYQLQLCKFAFKWNEMKYILNKKLLSFLVWLKIGLIMRNVKYQIINVDYTYKIIMKWISIPT